MLPLICRRFEGRKKGSTQLKPCNDTGAIRGYIQTALIAADTQADRGNKENSPGNNYGGNKFILSFFVYLFKIGKPSDSTKCPDAATF